MVARDCHIVTDLEHHFVFPTEITLTARRPGLVIWAVNLMKVFFVELTTHFEENIEWAHTFRLEKSEVQRK